MITKAEPLLFDELYEEGKEVLIVTTQPDGTGIKTEILSVLPEVHYFRDQVGYALTCLSDNTVDILTTIRSQVDVKTSFYKVVDAHKYQIDDLELSSCIKI